MLEAGRYNLDGDEIAIEIDYQGNIRCVGDQEKFASIVGEED